MLLPSLMVEIRPKLLHLGLTFVNVGCTKREELSTTMHSSKYRRTYVVFYLDIARRLYVAPGFMAATAVAASSSCGARVAHSVVEGRGLDRSQGVDLCVRWFSVFRSVHLGVLLRASRNGRRFHRR